MSKKPKRKELLYQIALLRRAALQPTNITFREIALDASGGRTKTLLDRSLTYIRTILPQAAWRLLNQNNALLDDLIEKDPENSES